MIDSPSIGEGSEGITRCSGKLFSSSLKVSSLTTAISSGFVILSLEGPGLGDDVTLSRLFDLRGLIVVVTVLGDFLADAAATLAFLTKGLLKEKTKLKSATFWPKISNCGTFFE